MFSSQDRKLRKRIDEALHWATKIYNYRCDVLGEARCQQLLASRAKLEQQQQAWNKHAPQPAGINGALEHLEQQLKLCGGRIYPINFWSDNAEVLWIAAFLALTIRAFFIQPFRIPTCSMFPSFSGMLTQLKPNTEKAPHFLIKPFRWLLTGAENYRYETPCNGFVQIPIFKPTEMAQNNSHIRYEVEYGREIGSLWFKHLLPKPYKVYILWVGHSQIRIRVPFEFTDMEALLRKKFFPEYKSFSQLLQSPDLNLQYSKEKGYYIQTENYAKKGDCCLHFDILCGDMVFVDRLTYHFRRPKVGEAIVFRTGNIPLLYKDLYYIKRLAGTPGDVLSIRGHQLFCNNKPATGSSAFENNNQRRGIYPGYVPSGLLEEHKHKTVSEHYFFALGDNSPFSYDSRYWGEVPEKDVLGKAMFVLHPVSWRWGRAEHDKSNVSASPQDYIFQ